MRNPYGFGEDPHMSTTLRRLGSVYSDMQQDDQAIDAFMRSLQSGIAYGGMRSEDTLNTYLEMFQHFIDREDFEASNACCLKILQINREEGGWRCPDNLLTIRRITICSQRIVDRIEDADQLARLVFIVASLWRSCEAFQNAFSLFGKIFELLGDQEEDDADRSDLCIAAEMNMGGIYWLQYEPADAESFAESKRYFERSYHSLLAAFGPADPLTIEESEWLKEFDNITKSAQARGWANWRIIPDAALRFATETIDIRRKTVQDRPVSLQTSLGGQSSRASGKASPASKFSGLAPETPQSPQFGINGSVSPPGISQRTASAKETRKRLVGARGPRTARTAGGPSTSPKSQPQLTKFEPKAKKMARATR